MRRTRSRRTAALTALLLVATACSSGDGDTASPPQPEPTATIAAATPAPTPTAEPTATATPAPTPIPAGELVPGLAQIASPYLGHETETSARPLAQCPGWDQFAAAEPIDEAYRTFGGIQNWAPFVQVGILDFADPDTADALLDAYLEGADGPCASFATTTAQGGPLNLTSNVAPGPELGDRSVLFLVRGETFGFPVNSDVVLVRVGSRVGYVGQLELGLEPDEGTRDAAAAAVTAALEGAPLEQAGDAVNSTTAIAAALPGLEELDNDALVFESLTAIPNSQCPDNPVTLGGLRATGSSSRTLAGNDSVFGPFVTVAILELPDGGADTLLDRWADGAAGPCADYLDSASALEFTVSSVPGPEYGDRTVTLSGSGQQLSLARPVFSDHVLIRDGDFVAMLTIFGEANLADASIRDRMAATLADALDGLA